MGRITEAISRHMMRQSLLQRFEEEVAGGEVATVDVFLKEGTEYAVKGRLLKGRGAVILSLGDVAGSPVPIYRNKGNCFFVTPERDGFYGIRATVEPGAPDRGPAVVSITLSIVHPLPWYVFRPAIIEEEPAEELPVKDVAVQGRMETPMSAGLPK